MKRLFLLIALLCASPLLAQDNWAYNFVTTGTRTPGITFANTSLTAFAISWDVSPPVLSCALQVDSSADGVSWGSADLIATQNCAVVGSVAATSLATGKNFVRINVTTFNGTGGLNVRLRGYAGAGGSSSSSTNPAPNMGFYWSPFCLVANTQQCFFAFADTLQFNDCNWTNSTTTLNCTAAHFTSAAVDVGKNIMGAQSFADDNQGSGSGGQIATTTAVTIATFVSSTQVTLSAIPANACAANCSIYFGHLDDASAVLLDAAMQAANTCPKMFSAAAYYYVTKPHFQVNPPACAAQGPGLGGSFGTTSLPAGFEWEGRGVGPTTIVHDTSFPNGDPCTTKATNSQVGGGCWAIPLMGKWTDLRFDGGNQLAASNLNGKNLITMAVGTLQNFTCTNIGWNGSVMVGINLGLLSQLYQVNISGCGNQGVVVEGGSGYSSAFRLIIENVAQPLAMGTKIAAGVPSLTCYWCIFNQKQPTTNIPMINNGGGNLLLYGGTIQPSNAPPTANTGITAYKCTVANGTASFDGVNINFSIGGSSQNAIWLNATGCTASVVNSWISSTQATSAVINDNSSTSGTRLFSLGGNTWIGAVNPPSAGINLNFSPSDNLTGLTGLTITCSANCGTSPSVIGRNESMVVTLGSATPAASTFTLTFIGNWPAAPSCQATRATTGTTPVPAGVVTTTTTAVVNLSANMVASEKYNITCGPGAL